MSKPLGLSLSVSDGGVGFHVNKPSKVEDAVWDAVEEAINAGWTPEQFRSEIADAWQERLRDDAKHAMQVLSHKN